MRYYLQIFLASILLVSFSNGSWSKKNWLVRAVGKVTCDGQPMPYIHIDLMDDDLTFDDKLATARANGFGSFNIQGSAQDGQRGKPDPYIRISYSYSGIYGNLKVVKTLKLIRREKSRTRSYISYVNFGILNFANIHCRAYLQFYSVLRHYKLVARSPLPYSTLYIQTKALLHGGTPYATTNVVRIPPKFTHISYATAKHEFAHTIRHSFDGSLGHFLRDVVRFKYTQHHTCSKSTNYGFAFNEGWANYWENSCHGHYGRPNDYEIEGNVAFTASTISTTCIAPCVIASFREISH